MVPTASSLLCGAPQVTTDARGAANATIDLSALPPDNVTQPGDAISIQATWIGPTREAIYQSATVRCVQAAGAGACCACGCRCIALPALAAFEAAGRRASAARVTTRHPICLRRSIADGPVRVELSRTLETDLPGVQFGVTVEAFSNEDDSALDGTAVTVTMVPANARCACVAWAARAIQAAGYGTMQCWRHSAQCTGPVNRALKCPFDPSLLSQRGGHQLHTRPAGGAAQDDLLRQVRQRCGGRQGLPAGAALHGRVCPQVSTTVLPVHVSQRSRRLIAARCPLWRTCIV